MWGCSSVGRTNVLHTLGHRFESGHFQLHMKTLGIKDKNQRYRFKLIEKKHKILKSIIRDDSLPFLVRYNAYLRLSCFSKKCSKVKIKNRCILTNRSKGVLRDFKLSRLVFRKMALKGELVGIQKSSW